jgi:hypothetical protein
MKCRFCGVELAPLRAVSDGEFCSARHHRRYDQSQSGDLTPELASALIPLDWWTFESASPVYAPITDPNESATLYSERPELLIRRGQVVFPVSMPTSERLLSLPLVAPILCGEPKPLEHSAAAVEMVGKPQLPSLESAPSRLAVPEVVPVLDRLFGLPFISPVVPAERIAIGQAAAAVDADALSKPRLPSLNLSAPSTFPVPEVVPEVVPAIERLFGLPFVPPVVATEPQLIAHLTACAEIVKKPHLLLYRIPPAIVSLVQLLPAPATEVVPQIVEAPAAESAPAPSATPVLAALPELPAAEPFASVATEQPPVQEPAEEALRGLAERAVPSVAWWTRLPRMWSGLPVHVRALAMIAPVALLLAFSRSLPSVPGTLGSNGAIPIQRVLAQGLGSFRQQLASRAAVDFTDDFRTGLDDWQGRGNTTAEWSYDAAGFVRPAKLALYRPTLALQDYRFEFLGQIDEKAMGCVFRAADPDNYYAIKFAISNPGPMPLVKLVRYAVVDGKEDHHEERPMPFLSSADTLYRVLIDVHGDDFTIMSQGKVVDFWSDNRLKTGGVGLFCGRGERARVRWVEVSHQYDTLGRLCAYLAPYSSQGRSGSFN